MALQARRIAETEFDGMKDAWNGLLEAGAAPSLFLRWEWIHSWWRTFGARKELCLIGLWDGADLAGVAPFYKETGRFKVVRFCGVELYPDYLDILARPGREKEVVEAAGAFLEKEVPGWHLLDVDDLLEGSNVLRFWPSAENYWTHWRAASLCPFIALEGTYQDYLKAQFDKKKRYNIERQVRVALTDKGLVWKKVETEAELSTALDHLFHLHGKRARDKEIVSSFSSDGIRRFHAEVSRLLLAAGRLRFSVLYDGAAPVSAVYGFADGGRLYFYQSGIDPEWSRFSVGTVLLTLMVRDAFDQGLREFDFLKGDESYKKTWKTGERRQFRLSVYRKSLLGAVLHSERVLKTVLKGWFKHSGTSSVPSGHLLPRGKGNSKNGFPLPLEQGAGERKS